MTIPEAENDLRLFLLHRLHTPAKWAKDPNPQWPNNISPHCCLCGLRVTETGLHLLLSCTTSEKIWNEVGQPQPRPNTIGSLVGQVQLDLHTILRAACYVHIIFKLVRKIRSRPAISENNDELIATAVKQLHRMTPL